MAVRRRLYTWKRWNCRFQKLSVDPSEDKRRRSDEAVPRSTFSIYGCRFASVRSAAQRLPHFSCSVFQCRVLSTPYNVWIPYCARGWAQHNSEILRSYSS